VLQCQKPVLVVFCAEWSGASDIMVPILRELNDDFKQQIKFGTIDIDSNKSLANRYRISGLPTFLFFNSGKAVGSIQGAVPKQIISSKLEAIVTTSNKHLINKER
jgi:thioredoxin 1